VRVWIDPLTPKQALFFTPLREVLLKEGNEVLVTTRAYREAEQTLQMKKVKYVVAGRHGGGTKLGKLIATGERIVELAKIVARWKPDVAVSFTSPEAARVAFGLGIPHVAVNDSPHSWMVAKLAVPLSRFVCSPWIIPRPVWLELGARHDGVVFYKALDPAAWLKRFTPDEKVFDSLGLDRDRPLIMIRTEEAFAAYLIGRASDSAPVVGPVISDILEMKLDVQIVVSTRYGRQAPVLRKSFGRKIVVLDTIVDATSLLKQASFFIGSGGTMTVESVLLGTPAVSCFPGPRPLYIQYLENKRLVETLHSPKSIASRAREALVHPERFESQRSRGRALLKWMEDPVKRISKVVREGC